MNSSSGGKMSNEIEIKAKNGNMTPIVRRAIESAEENTVLMFEAAEYHFYGADCYEGEFYPSNNKSERPHPNLNFLC